jgi:hypothetical protein
MLCSFFFQYYGESSYPERLVTFALTDEAVGTYPTTPEVKYSPHRVPRNQVHFVGTTGAAALTKQLVLRKYPGGYNALHEAWARDKTSEDLRG